MFFPFRERPDLPPDLYCKMECAFYCRRSDPSIPELILLNAGEAVLLDPETLETPHPLTRKSSFFLTLESPYPLTRKSTAWAIKSEVAFLAWKTI